MNLSTLKTPHTHKHKNLKPYTSVLTLPINPTSIAAQVFYTITSTQ